MNRLLIVVLGIPLALQAQPRLPTVALQVGAAEGRFGDGADRRWATLGLASTLGRRLDVIGRVEYASDDVPSVSVCAGNAIECGAAVYPLAHITAFIGELAWWSGRGKGVHAVVTPGLARQHAAAPRMPYERRDWLAPQFSVGAAWCRGRHALSAGVRWRSDHQWAHMPTQIVPTLWVGWQSCKSADDATT